MSASARRLAWADLVNARDLGGLPLPGGRVRAGALVRSDNVDRLTEAGRQALLAHGVATIVDLRAARELAVRPNPFRDHAGFRHLPFMEAADMDRVPTFERSEDLYDWLVEHRASAIAAVLRGIADAPEGGVLIHCNAGKDRTGIVAALALAVAGVDRASIAEDYALSVWWMERMMEEELAAVGDPVRREYLRRTYEPRPEIILSTLAALDERHGGVPAYLAAAGLEAEALERLRLRLR